MGFVVRTVIGLVVGIVVRTVARLVLGAVMGFVVRTVIGLVVGIGFRTVIGALMSLVVRVVIGAVRLVVGVIRLVICFSEFQYAFAILIIDVAMLESRVDARPLFIFTFCPSFFVEVIEVVSPTQIEFPCFYIVVLDLNPIDFSSSYVCISKRVINIRFIESKDSHDEVLWLSEILNSVAVHTSHYFVINFV